MARTPKGSGKRRRGLSDDEQMLWGRVAATAQPLNPLRQSLGPTTPTPSLPKFEDVPPAPDLVPVTHRRISAPRITFDLGGDDVRPVRRKEAGFDRRTADRIRRGERAPDARIDLHGMTTDRAHRACLRFLGDAVAQGHRLVLVITGKGRSADGHGRGILRASLPGWLRASPFGHSILGIFQAAQRHGGEGAFYVALKRRR